MGKAVIHAKLGSYYIPAEAVEYMRSKGLNVEDVENLPRHHPLLIEAVEVLGKEAAPLRVAHFDGDIYRITEYDGYEEIETPDTIEWCNVNEL